MKELKTLTECQVLYLALETLIKRIHGEEMKKKKCGKDNIEGIVFWKDGAPQCKIKRSDFGFPWNKK